MAAIIRFCFFFRFALTRVVRIYQFLVSPWLGRCCRFSPSCSQYAIDAIHAHGCTKGCWLTFCRVLCCHPWHPGGEDPIPPIKTRIS